MQIQNLQIFHQSCKDEFKTILNSFNLLLYGYGNKVRILSIMFPDAKIYNMRFSTIQSIVEDLLLEGYCNKNTRLLSDIDSYLFKSRKKLILILTNFNFSDMEFKDLKAIQIIGTVENIYFEFNHEDLVEFNFILRDFTTFEDYTDDIVEIDIVDNKVQNVLTVLSNLSKKSKLIFKELLKLGNCSITELFEAVKKDLFLTKVGSCLDLLKEFVDHKIIKINENKLTINLNVKERNNLIEKFEKGDVSFE